MSLGDLNARFAQRLAILTVPAPTLVPALCNSGTLEDAVPHLQQLVRRANAHVHSLAAPTAGATTSLVAHVGPREGIPRDVAAAWVADAGLRSWDMVSEWEQTVAVSYLIGAQKYTTTTNFLTTPAVITHTTSAFVGAVSLTATTPTQTHRVGVTARERSPVRLPGTAIDGVVPVRTKMRLRKSFVRGKWACACTMQWKGVDLLDIDRQHMCGILPQYLLEVIWHGGNALANDDDVVAQLLHCVAECVLDEPLANVHFQAVAAAR